MGWKPPPELWISLIVAVLLTVMAILTLRRHAERLSLIDHPGHRKNHGNPTPLVGGIAIICSVLIAALVFDLWHSHTSAFWLSLITLFLTGVLDDLKEFSHRPKFFFQLFAAAMVVFWDHEMVRHLGNLLGTGPIELPRWVAIPFTFIGIVGVVNAVNMIDGVDGLAGSLSLVSLLAFALIAFSSGAYATFHLLMLFSAALVGFLAFNLRAPWRQRASVFLGDAGSLTLGFLSAWCAVHFTNGQSPSIQPVTALWLLAIPLWDAVRLILTRLAQRRNPFHADREHVHHRLLDVGLSPGKTTAILIAAHSLLVSIGLANEFWWHFPAYVMFYLFLLFFLLFAILFHRPLTRFRNAGGANHVT